MTPHEAAVHVTSTNPTFEVHEVDVRGVRYRAFKNIPTDARALLTASRAAHGGGSAEYLVFNNERWTFDDFSHSVNKVANSLKHTFSVKPGDPVAIAMRNCPEYLILIMAIASVGAVTVFLNAWWTKEELEYALRDSRSRLVFADKKRIERIDELAKGMDLVLIGVRDGETVASRQFAALLACSDEALMPTVEIDPDDDFAIMYSSGTTGHPKGVVQTHRGAMNAVFTWLMQAVMAPLIDPPPPEAPEPPRPAGLISTPLFHVTATHALFLLSIPAGAKIVLLDKWDPIEAARVIDREKITRFLGVPTQSADLMDSASSIGMKLKTLDFIGAGGAKRPAPQVEELAQTFPAAKIATGWGMTETNANGFGLIGPDYVERPDTSGRLYPPVQAIRFLDEDGVDVAVGNVGEITVKSPCNMRCYLNKPEATDEVLKDGWLRTGDLGFIDSDGFITIVDRKKDIIIRGGENISCLDVEGVLHKHPSIQEACAFSIPHERLGETVGAAVQLRPGSLLTKEELIAFLKAHIAHFKIPETVWFCSTPLPRGATDKTDRRALRKQCLATPPDKEVNT